MAIRKSFKPQVHDDYMSEEDEGNYKQFRSYYKREGGQQAEEAPLSDDSEEDQGMSAISFGALNSAAQDFDESDSDAPPEENSSGPASDRVKKRFVKTAKTHKHAPSESSTKRPVSRIRAIPGLTSTSQKNGTSLYIDPRFDAAYGKADLAKARKNYAFLDGYREDEIKTLQKSLGAPVKKGKLMSKTGKGGKKAKPGLQGEEREEVELEIHRLQSRLKTLRDRDLEDKVVKEFKSQQRKKAEDGKLPYFLKNSDKRKLVLTEKFKNMRKKEVNKVIERRRKKNASKERKEMPDRRE
ncbi:DUF947-domain-containing protein [Nadsonia fulvescens var. elongata DSM 6958]|uniref:rRNA biogenesis protein RRP36 n=1 Tax=Nadsonia fulvescens var. elongata DSM 6958 TaxID=857566 RepID=A0A1E3PJR5_9ASCO|nr:DUF947-domain-containing protein [Nadsonia fulvescens var. elongata DSM 6958]